MCAAQSGSTSEPALFRQQPACRRVRSSTEVIPALRDCLRGSFLLATSAGPGPHPPLPIFAPALLCRGASVAEAGPKQASQLLQIKSAFLCISD
jgi:hypothetical protein